jgi:predicted ATPase
VIISRIRLRNWKNFQEVDLELTHRMFIVGPNAAGKSNFLDAFRFLRDIAKGSGGGLQKAVADRGGFSSLRCYGARRYPYIEIEIAFSPSAAEPASLIYSLGLTQETSGHRRPVIKYEKVTRDGIEKIGRPNSDDANDAELLTETYLEQTSRNREFRDIPAFLGSICYLHLVPQLLRHPEAFIVQGLSDDPFGRTFLERLAEAPEKTRTKRLKKIEEAMKIIAPNLKNLEFDRDSKGTPHLYATYIHWRPNAGRQSEIQFSDGTLRSIGLLWSLLERNALLLLEEPELSLNSEIVKHIPSILYSLIQRNRRQVLLSTHSWDLLSDKSIGANEVIVLQPGKERTSASLLSHDADSVELMKNGLAAGEVAVPLSSPHDAVQLSLQFDKEDPRNGI